MRYFALTYITMPDDCGDAEALGDLVGAAARNAKAISEAIEREENRVAVEKERIRKAVAKQQEEADARQRPQQGPKRATEIKMSDHDDGVSARTCSSLW